MVEEMIPIKGISMTRIEVIGGDIAQVPVDVLVTAINSQGAWLGGIDVAIQRCAGQTFHAQAAGKQLVDGELVFTTSAPHRGLFSSVLFIVDDHRRPLRQLVSAALHEINQRRLRSVSLPIIRTGNAAGRYEPNARVAREEMAKAINEFVATNPQHLTEIKVVAYREPIAVQHLKQVLHL